MPDTLETSQHFIFVCVISHLLSHQILKSNPLPPQDASLLLLCVLFAAGLYGRYHLKPASFIFLKQCVSKDINRVENDIDVDFVG
jgi:hypothetical protein